MTGFHDVRFPMRLARGATGGPERRTEILTLASGKEVRNSVWASARRRWDVGGAISDLASLYELISFFEARQGRLFGFRFRDPMDHSSAVPATEIGPEDQVLGTGDDVMTRFSVIKDYGGTQRVIPKPVEESLRVSLDGVELSIGWSFDPITSEIVFDVPPDSHAIVTAGYEFDCRVRFESDQLTGIIEAFGAGRVASVGLVELL